MPLCPFLFSLLTGCCPHGLSLIFKSSINTGGAQLCVRSAKNISFIFCVYILAHLALKALFLLVATRYFILQTGDVSVSTVLNLDPVRSKLLMLPKVLPLPPFFSKVQSIQAPGVDLCAWGHPRGGSGLTRKQSSSLLVVRCQPLTSPCPPALASTFGVMSPVSPWARTKVRCDCV